MLRHTTNKRNKPINILIKPQSWQEKDTAAKWFRHINYTLSHDHTFSQQIGKIYLLERAHHNTNTDTIIASNPQTIYRHLHSTVPNHVHHVHYIDTPTHEGEWVGDKMEYARAHHCHKYIIHEFRTITLETHMPTVGVIPTHDMRDHTADDASDATMCSYTPTQITVHYFRWTKGDSSYC